ncbi:H-NS histone family [Thioflavicoccus mobilis 8321]|uniref:H-NS histone family n=1 Tax=Thioflavicoccus mobilis 8321 TaxID=765912 RepID=L0GUL3_9GAMM|nr:H-NS histone family protein [Thioflavicoccus mobilis]AGA88979.1 H-NS histone family [Thioflavicoccus mobilis 8321]
MEYANLSVDELQQQLEKLQQSQADLERALEVRRQEGKHEVAQEVKDIIQRHGYDLNEILPLLSSRRRRAPSSGKTSSRPYPQYVDPDNPKNVYVRGVIPGWMKQKMQEQGYDPTQKEDRDAFKANCLKVVES